MTHLNNENNDGNDDDDDDVTFNACSSRFLQRSILRSTSLVYAPLSYWRSKMYLFNDCSDSSRMTSNNIGNDDDDDSDDNDSDDGTSEFRY